MRKWLPLLAVCLGTFMLLIDVTIVNVALPDLTKALDASFTDLQWVIDIYALSLAALLLGAGALADEIGRKRVYLAGLTIFALASLACGTAQNVEWMIIGRAVQGIGGAAMFATTIALLNVSYTGRDRGTAYGVWGAVSGAAAGAGVVAGGILTELLSWHWVFFVNLPISVAAIALTAFVFTDGPRKPFRLDFAGMVTFTAAAGLITYAIIEAGEDGWTAGRPIGAALGGVIAFVVFVIIQRSVAKPLVDLGLLRSRAFTGATLAAFVLSGAAFGSLALVSIWLQSVIGLSPLQTGLALLPMAATAFVVAGASGQALVGVPAGVPISIGLAFIGAGDLVMLIIGGGSSWPALMPGLVVIGIGVGLATPPLTSAALAAVPLERSGMAAGVVNTARQLGLALGVAILGSVFTARAATSLGDAGVPRAHDLAPAVSGGQTPVLVASAPEQFRAGLETAIHHAFASGLDVAFIVAGAAALVGSALAFTLLRNAPKPAWEQPSTATPAAEAQAGSRRPAAPVAHD